MLIETERTARQAVPDAFTHTGFEHTDGEPERELHSLFHPEQLRGQFACRPVDPANSRAGYCALIETEADFRRLGPLWRAFEDAQPAASLFASWSWVWNWWQDFGRHPHDGIGESHPFVLAVLSPAHELRGLLPFHVPARRVGGSGLRALRLFGCLGKHHESLTEEPPLLLQAGQERQATEAALAVLLREQTRRGWDLIELWVGHSEAAPPAAPPIPGSPLGLGSMRRSLQTRVEHRRVLPVLSLSLPPAWEPFHSGLSRLMRRNLRYYPRLLADQGHAWDICLATDPLDVAREAEALVALHRLRESCRRGAPPGSHLPTGLHRRFLTHQLSAWAAQGRASVAVLRINGHRAAAQALLTRGQAAMFYYSGFDPAWAAYSPLTLLHADVFARLIAGGTRTVNLLAEAHPWKTRWGAQETAQVQQLSYVLPRPDAWLRVLLYAREARAARATQEWP